MLGTVTPVPARIGRPLRISGFRTIRVPISLRTAMGYVSRQGFESLIAMMIFPLQKILHRIDRGPHPSPIRPHQRLPPPQPLLGGVDEVRQALAPDGAHGD